MQKWGYYIIGSIPIAFLFHLYEYGQHVKREDAPLLWPMMITFVIVSTWFSRYVRKRTVLFIQLVSFALACGCAALWLEDDGTWFIPGGKYVAITIIWVMVIVAQWVFRLFLIESIKK